jgi:hypothetical protein
MRSLGPRSWATTLTPYLCCACGITCHLGVTFSQSRATFKRTAILRDGRMVPHVATGANVVSCYVASKGSCSHRSSRPQSWRRPVRSLAPALPTGVFCAEGLKASPSPMRSRSCQAMD